MLFFAVSSAGSCSPTSLPGFRHPGFRLSFRSSLLFGPLSFPVLSPLPGFLSSSRLSSRSSLPSSRHSSRSSPFSPVLSPLGSLSGPLYPLPGFLFSSSLPPLSLFSFRLVLSSFRPFFLQPPLSAPPLIRGRGASRRPCGAALRADRRGFRGSKAASCRGCRTPEPRCGAAAP